MKILYDCLFFLCLPLLTVQQYLSACLRRVPHRLSERWALNVLPPVDIWLHAASVGEVNAAIPMIDRLLAQFPEQSILITTQTQTGSQRVVSRYQGKISHQLAPWDAPFIMSRFVRQLSPSCLILMETELWPNMLLNCQQRDIPVIIANARISDRTYQRYRWGRRLFADVLRSVTAILAQSQHDQQRFIALGAHHDHVMQSGNLKYSMALSTEHRRQATAWREQLGPRPIWIAASTHPGEEALVLEAFAVIKQQYPDVLLILVPRHPKRVTEIQPLTQAWNTQKRTEFNPHQALDILLVDTIGECLMFYGVADVALIGGSLVPVGGHNPIEPGLWGIPLICGPFTHNFKAIVADFQRVDGLNVVTTADELAKTVLSCMSDQNKSAPSVAAVTSLITTQSTSLKKHMDTIESLLT